MISAIYNPFASPAMIERLPRKMVDGRGEFTLTSDAAFVTAVTVDPRAGKTFKALIYLDRGGPFVRDFAKFLRGV
jgi:hypothetical protein